MPDGGIPTPPWPPRGLREVDAAYYVGLSVSTFRREVGAGHIPAAVRLTEARKIWLRDDLDRYLDAKAGRVPASEDINPWH